MNTKWKMYNICKNKLSYGYYYIKYTFYIKSNIEQYLLCINKNNHNQEVIKKRERARWIWNITDL